VGFLKKAGKVKNRAKSQMREKIFPGNKQGKFLGLRENKRFQRKILKTQMDLRGKFGS
jgi:ribosomal protein S30